jgi:hypothetical protein
MLPIVSGIETIEKHLEGNISKQIYAIPVFAGIRLFYVSTEKNILLNSRD